MVPRERIIKRCGMGNSQGFTLLELSIVLIIIGVILGAVTSGTTLQRSAEYTKIQARFVSPWVEAYNEFYARAGVVVGDDPLLPTGRVNGANDTTAPFDALCDAALFALMDAQGVEMPPGRAEGSEDRYAYEDTNHNPQQIKVCFQNLPWRDSAGDFSDENVMVITGLIPDLARKLDVAVDTRQDARFGLFRDEAEATTGTASRNWSRDNRDQIGTNNDRNFDEDQVEIVTAYYRMNQ